MTFDRNNDHSLSICLYNVFMVRVGGRWKLCASVDVMTCHEDVAGLDKRIFNLASSFILYLCCICVNFSFQFRIEFY